ncbi:MAG: hypothetical protein ACR2RF_05955 [Geminicoccaceae bacterium]
MYRQLLTQNRKVSGVGPTPLAIGAPVATTSGTSVDVTAGFGGAKRISLLFTGVSTNGVSPLMLQLGDSGGFETSSYLGSASNLSTAVGTAQHSSGFQISGAVAGTTIQHGILTLVLQESATNTWVIEGGLGHSNATVTTVVRGAKALSDVLTQIRLTTVGGSDTFDAGSISVMVET